MLTNCWSLAGRRALQLQASLPLYRKCLSGSVAGSEPLQLTLAIIKPHIVKDPYSLQAIRQIILDDGFYYIRSTCRALTTADAEDFYAEHRGKFFYNRLVAFMSSGDCAVHLLARQDAIARWRTLMGPTKVYRTRLEQPATIRGRFGATDTRNATHGSDSEETARRESGFFFPDFSFTRWTEVEEPLYRQAGLENQIKVDFDWQRWQHSLWTSVIDDDIVDD